MLEKIDNVIFFNDDVVFNTDSDVTLFSDAMCLANIYLNSISLDYVKSHDDDPETIIHVRVMVWCNRYKQRKACKKEISKWLMSVA